MKHNYIKKTYNAQLTVMAAMIFMVVISFITTCVNSATMSGYNTVIKQSCSLSDESVFTAYNNELLNQFDIFALKKSDMMNDKIYKYIQTNISSYSNQIELERAEYDEYKYMTDDGGYAVEEQIIRYMESGGYADIIREYNDVSESVKQSESVNKVSEIMMSAQEAAQESWDDTIELLKVCINISDKEEEAKSYISSLGNYVGNIESGELTEINVEHCISISRQLKNILEYINTASGKAYDIISIYEEHNKLTEKNIEKCYEELDRIREELGEQLYSGIVDDIADMQTEYQEGEVLVVEDIRKNIDYDCSVIQAVSNGTDIIKELCINISDTGEYETSWQDNMESLNSVAENVKAECHRLKMYTVVNQYQHYVEDNKSKEDGITSLKRIYKLFKEGITEYVIDGEISDKVMNYDNLSDNVVTGKALEYNITNMSVRSAIINEYIMSRYVCYTDFFDTDNSAAFNRLLDYEIEYILCGEKSDRDNLSEVITRLSLIREGVNLSYLITDSGKKRQCFMLAAELIGYTGNMVLIKAGQYLVMAIWAYAEAIAEIHELYDGKRIYHVKNSNNWMTDIDGLISVDNNSATSVGISQLKKVDITHKDSEEGEEVKGFNYGDYMRILLLMQDRTDKNSRIVSAMELRMIAGGNSDFRMCDYIYEAKGEATFRYKDNGQVYRQRLMYSYIS